MNYKYQTREMIQDIVQKIVAGYSPQRIILFGSYAYGEPDEDSDIDLLIIKDTNKRNSVRTTSCAKLLLGRKH